MRTLLAITCAVFALPGCKSRQLLSVETDLAAAKGRLATLEKRRLELMAESRKLQVERQTLSQQADEASLARERLVGAGLALRKLPIPDGVLLDEALRAKSPKLGVLAASIVQRQLPCVDPEAEAPAGPDGPGCEPPPLDDACLGVAERTIQSLEWSCQVVTTPNAPASAVCVATAELQESTYPLSAPTTRVQGDVVRLAFEKKGRLFVADWPSPQLDFYRPPNSAELATCQAENDHAQCIRSCDERHGRLVSACGDWGDDGAEGPQGDDENPEPYEVRAAREAAERAEREAERARDELSYQECLASCEGGSETSPEPIARIEVSYQRSPAPGVFQFEVALAGEDGGVPPHTLLLSFPALLEELSAGVTPLTADTVLELSTELDVGKLLEGKPVDGQQLLGGVTPDGVPVAVRIALDGKSTPTPLDLDAVCDFAEQVQNAPMREACAVAKARRDEANAKAQAKAAQRAAKADAGAPPPDAGADAGGAP
jgi:hypothetical protein